MMDLRRQIRSGLWLYDIQSRVPHFFRRYCHMRLRSLVVKDAGSLRPVAPFVHADEQLLLFMHSSRQTVRIAWMRMISDDECCCGLVMLRRPEICLPGLQAVCVRDGTKMVAAGEVISTKTMKQLTKRK